jgi:hypothetical protein
MFRCKALFLILGLSVSTPVLANAPHQEELASTLAEFGPALGRIDYCGGGGQALFESYARGLEEFRLRPSEIQALLTMTQERREESRAQAAEKFGGRPCPADIRKTVQKARKQIDMAWRQIVRNAPSLNIRPAVVKALNMSAPASAPSPTPTPTPASTPTDGTPATAGLCVKGRAVSVLQAGEWHPAKVLDGPDGMGTCLVSYDGFGSNWDEWVSAKRMRAGTGSEASTTTSQPPATPASVPPGKYSCYTFDNGMLNYAYTDVQILDGSRYAVGAKGGSYTLSGGGAMRFTGTMSNATGTFSVKSSGKPQIDLVFNGDARASMACSKAR